MGDDAPVDVVSRNVAFRAVTRITVMLRTAAAVALPAIVVCACGTQPAPVSAPVRSHAVSASPAPSPFLTSASPSPSRSPKPRASATPSPSRTPSPSARPAPAPSPSRTAVSASAAGCQHAFVPAYFYAGSDWTQSIDAKPAPGVMLLNVDNGVGTSPLSHFQALARQAQAAGITVLGYSSTVYGKRSIGSVETEVREYKAWYGVNGIFLDLTQGTAGELSYYRTLASYIRSIVPNAVIWLNPGSFPDASFMSVANVIMVFEGSYSSFLQDQVPSWVSKYSPDQFANVIYATSESDLSSTLSLSRARRVGHLFVTDLPGSPNPYGSLPSYWTQEAPAIPAD